MVRGQVYMDFKSLNRWVLSAGATFPVPKLPNTHCCYTGAEPQRRDLGWARFAYNIRCSVSNSPTFLLQDGCHHVQVLRPVQESEGHCWGSTIASFAMTGLLINRSKEGGTGKAAAAAYFRYHGTESSRMSNHSSTTFHPLPKGPAKLWSIENLT